MNRVKTSYINRSQTNTTSPPVSKWVRRWLIAGIIMIFFQIILGGITRITGSGLSITRWDIVSGTLPPMSEAAWHEAFDLYKQTPQYHKINYDMPLQEFKFIFFWEYIHRLWARTMGFVFLFPLLYFVSKRMIPKWLGKRLVVVFLLAALVASFGWIMVASGLVNRPLVNAYKLSIHLGLAFLLLGYLYWTYLMAGDVRRVPFHTKNRKWIKALSGLVGLQIILGGIMSGMKAGMYYPSWPKMNGDWIPDVLTHTAQWTAEHIIQYDAYRLMPALIQFLHRGTGYLIFVAVVSLLIITLRSGNATEKLSVTLLFMLVFLQLLLGIYTVINCLGEIPLWLGVMHQITAILVFLLTFYLLYSSKPMKIIPKGG